MNPAFVIRLTAVAALSSSLAAVAAVTPNPYAHISASNVFRLQPPRPRDIEVRPVQGKILPQIFITGLIELQGVPRALVEISEPGQPVKRPILAAGGSCELLQVLQIDVAGERVRVRIDGEEETLSIQAPKPQITTHPGSLATPLPPMPTGFKMQGTIRG